MEIAYKKNKFKNQLSNASEIKRNFGVNAKRVATRLDEIRSCKTLAILKQIPAANCHPLSGERLGQWAVDVSVNFRLIFEIDHDPVPTIEDGSVALELVTNIRLIEVADYH